VPWCIKGKIYSKKVTHDKIEIVADLTIGKSFFNETYKSNVVYNKNLDSILVNNIEGPLKHLDNKWFFKKKGNNSEVNFHINFELKSKILNLIMTKSFDIGLKKIADAFEKRAIDLF
jgi:coenzyme Q-binding protein COQ10